MWITVNQSGHITGKFAAKPDGGDCFEVSDESLGSVRFPKWDMAAKKIINDPQAAEAARISAVKAELAAMDVKMPRALEDLWDAVGKSPPEPVAALIAQKRALRAQLKSK
jgi:hypothetical protein